jgi:hypothetical protein
MDTTQLLLTTAVTITTILLIVISIQLISLLKQLKKDHHKEIHHVGTEPNNQPIGGKKERTTKKRVSLTVLLNKMKDHIAHPHSPKKTFFKS